MGMREETRHHRFMATIRDAHAVASRPLLRTPAGKINYNPSLLPLEETMGISVSMTVNGKAVTAELEPRTLLQAANKKC